VAEQIDQSTASSEAPRGAASPHLVTVSKRLWKIVLLGGAAVWLLAAVVTEVTDDHVLVPMVIDVGSFLVPVTMVTFALSRLKPFLTLEQIALAFLAAGTLGVVASASLEIYLLPATTGTFLGVGVIEELGKGAVLLAVAYHVPRRAPRNGMVLGAIVGAGFAAFESAGYAVSTLIEHVDDSPIVNIMETEATRALLAPFGHITWTALVGGALFASSRNGSFHVTRRLLLTLAGVMVLHALWDQTYGWSILLAEAAAGAEWVINWPHAQTWYASPTSEELLLFTVFYDVLLGINALLGTTWIVRSWRTYARRERAAAAPGLVNR
jgi:RsiW-degrading membrane proteinase PrsW (M82 family)